MSETPAEIIVKYNSRVRNEDEDFLYKVALSSLSMYLYEAGHKEFFIWVEQRRYTW